MGWTYVERISAVANNYMHKFSDEDTELRVLATGFVMDKLAFLQVEVKIVTLIRKAFNLLNDELLVHGWFF